MQITTKYNIGDSVWCFHHNRPEQMIIEMVRTTTTGKGTRVVYDMADSFYYEEELYKTREELVS